MSMLCSSVPPRTGIEYVHDLNTCDTNTISGADTNRIHKYPICSKQVHVVVHVN